MSKLFERVRSLYGWATAYNANENVPKHIQGIRIRNLEEFDRMIEEIKAEAWDEGYQQATYTPGGGNPYLNQEEA